MNFKLPFLPERPEKPRKNGATMMMDKGLSLREAENFIDKAGHLTDYIKLGFGTSIVSTKLQEKIKMYQDSGMKVYMGGTLFEAFLVRDKVGDYKKLLDKFGLVCCEVSDGSITIPHDRKLELISDFAKDYEVLSEVGSKEEGIFISPGLWINMMKTELEAGSSFVIAEARESGTVGIYRPNGTAHTMLINRILANVEKDRILWEAPIKNQQVWFIKNLGHNVNLGNIGPDEVIPLETLRLGLRGDTFFDHLPESVVEKHHD
ncbi:MAG: phosphosulfolactate synthase [Flavobacteriales bacterium]|nr:phosphosulfolactate synthase [Flavobacteriales bacterium]